MIRLSENWPLVPTVLLAILLGTSIGLASSPLLGTFVALLALAVVATFWYPFEIAAAGLAVGALLPSYIDLKYLGLPVHLNGSLAVALLLGVAAAVAGLSERRSLPGFSDLVAPAAFALLWVGGPFFAGEGDFASRVSYLLTTSAAGAVAVVAVAVLVASSRGRRCVAAGIVGGGVLAAGYGAIEYFLGSNPLLVFGARLDPSAAKYLTVPARFGMQRISGAFSHPIMFSIFLGIAIICVIGIYRSWHLLPLWAAAVSVAALLVVDVGTLSRAAIGLCVLVCCLWLALSARTRPARTLAVAGLVLLLIGAGLIVQVSGVARELVNPDSQSEAGSSIAYRIQLARSLVREFAEAPLFGNAQSDEEAFLGEFESLDNQVAALLRSRGFVGLFAYLLLGLAPLVGFRRVTEQSKFGASIAVFLLGVSATVAIFGSVQVYVLVAFVLALGLVRSQSVRGGGIAADV